MKVSKNYLDNTSFSNIKETLLSPYFPWYYNEGVVKINDGQSQLVHTFFDKDNGYINSNYFQIIQPILNKFKIFTLLRIKANLTLKTDNHVEYGFHNDYSKNDNCKITTAIFYVNTNNGYTIIEDKKVVSKENTFVEFDSTLKHSGFSSTDSLKRLVINFNYIKL